MDKKEKFFIFLIENYANKKNISTKDILKKLDEKNKISYINDMYEIYHAESLENAYKDIDRIIDL